MEATPPPVVTPPVVAPPDTVPPQPQTKSNGWVVVIIGVLVAVVVLMISSQANAAPTTTNKRRKVRYVANRDGVLVFSAIYVNGEFMPDFTKSIKSYKRNETVGEFLQGELSFERYGITIKYLILESDSLPKGTYLAVGDTDVDLIEE
jgi:hypothetical protein